MQDKLFALLRCEESQLHSSTFKTLWIYHLDIPQPKFFPSSSSFKVLTSHSDMIDISIPWICLLTICWSKCNTSCILLNGNRCIQAFCWKEGKIPLRNARKSFDLAIVASLKGFWLVFRSRLMPNPFQLAWKERFFLKELWQKVTGWIRPKMTNLRFLWIKLVG